MTWFTLANCWRCLLLHQTARVIAVCYQPSAMSKITRIKGFTMPGMVKETQSLLTRWVSAVMHVFEGLTHVTPS